MDRPRDDEIADAIDALLAERAAGATICPSEVARALERPGVPWRSLMDDVRHTAARLVEAGQIAVTQHGHEVDPTFARGPIRLRRKPSVPSSER